MANTSSARKANKASKTKRIFNMRRTRVMKSTVKEVSELIHTKDKAGAEKVLPGVYKALDKAVKRGIIKPNTASRKKSRIMKAIKGIS